MKLHNDKDIFNQAIRGASEYFKIEPSLVEKDYFVTLVLHELAKKVDGLLFKGGTSLSKCYKIIDRFSEDIDITLDSENLTQSKKQKLKYIIVDVCNELRLNLINESETRSRRDYNKYVIEYPITYGSSAVAPQLLIETVFIQKAYPSEIKQANSLIGEWLIEIGNTKAVEMYELYPFDIRVQTLERTLVDKVFALCDYFMEGKIQKRSRHIYDISRLLTLIKLDSNLKVLVGEVREERKSGKLCYSAQDGVHVPDILAKIIETEVYKRDYIENTQKLLFKQVSYDDAIKAICAIIESGVFELINQ
jgi:predicted nucleotidyltransferase component of viral defense system